MARTEIPEIAVAVRTFGNSKMQEGIRVKAGTRFAVGKPQGDLKLLTVARFGALKAQGLMRGLNDEDTAALPKRPIEERTAEQIAKNRAVPKPITAESIRRPSVRAAARRRTQEQDPPAPRRLNPTKPEAEPAPPGSPNGTAQQPSLSAVDPASNTSKTTSRPRGRRRASAG